MNSFSLLDDATTPASGLPPTERVLTSHARTASFRSPEISYEYHEPRGNAKDGLAVFNIKGRQYTLMVNSLSAARAVDKLVRESFDAGRQGAFDQVNEALKRMKKNK